jgi:hypothetical protein
MRTSKAITEAEQNVFNKFCTRNHILNDQSAEAIQNGKHVGGHRKIYWKELPKTDRSIGPRGLINHAVVNKSEEGFMPRSQTTALCVRQWKTIAPRQRRCQLPCPSTSSTKQRRKPYRVVRTGRRIKPESFS